MDLSSDERAGGEMLSPLISAFVHAGSQDGQ